MGMNPPVAGSRKRRIKAVEHDSPKSLSPRPRGVILKRLAKLEEEIEKGRIELEGLLK